MGAVLLVGGAKGKRFALPNSTVMLHQAAGGFEGTASDIEIRAREILRLQSRIREILQEHTGQPMERIIRDSDRDFFMTPEQATEYGIIDRIIGRSEIGEPADGTAEAPSATSSDGAAQSDEPSSAPGSEPS
jgi:ATP-dependent Clp protease protease subunit